ncbi:S41 family peptidase [Patescibacteria group bacterium]|nr:S41 family peptidase [Patescibacteria group bacterium]MCL5409715.1 S41 family peptidase [Patescibacteria group bacterium]
MKKILQTLYQGFRRVNGGLIIIIILVFVLGWQLGHRDYQLQVKNYQPKFSVSNQLPSDQNVNIDFSLFWQTWNLLSEKYIDKKALDPQKMYYGAIQGMVAAVGDPYTVFLPPSSQQTSKEQLGGSFEGVGIQLEYDKDNHLVVVAPLKDTPADKAGVKAGDLIVGINGKDTTNLSLPDAVSLIKGPKGTSVTLALLSANDTKPHDITITRDTIVVKSVEYESKTTPTGKNVAYIRVASFGEKTDSEWDSAVSQALANAPQGVVVDLRNNPGGYLDSAVYLASEFLDGGTVVMQEDAQGNRTKMDVIRVGKMLKLPLVVLINKGSASASEIFSGAMQDRQRATLVGDQSFGKGTIQSAEDLPEGTGIHITTAKWLTPDGRWIHHIGLTPDMKVDMGTDPAKDPQLDKALEILDSK